MTPEQQRRLDYEKDEYRLEAMHKKPDMTNAEFEALWAEHLKNAVIQP